MTDSETETSAPPTLAGPPPGVVEPRGAGGGATEPGRSQPPTRIGRYEIVERLGSGGTGTVYKARDPELNRVIAVKVLLPGTDAARLKREAQALAKLDHPNVVPIYDVGAQGEPFIAMKHVDGENLRAWAATPRRRADVLRVLLDAGRGVAAAHAAGLIHRDLKPENVFVSRTGPALVGDFGVIAEEQRAGERAEESTDLTRSTDLGTPAYMAPEQAAGEPASFASDQFAFCVMAWEALTGARPFAGTTLEDLAENARADKPAMPGNARTLPPRLAAVLRRGLSASASARFGSMDELLRVLAPSRRRWPIAGGAAFGLGAITALIALARPPAGSQHAALLPCGDEASLLEETWSTKQRAALVERAREQGPLPRLATHNLAQLDRIAAAWTGDRVAACALQPLHGRAYYEDRLACFDDAYRRLGITTRTLAEHPDVLVDLDTAMFLETELSSDRCSRPGLTRVDPPSESQRAKIDGVLATRIRLQLAPDPKTMLQDLAGLQQAADQLGYPPLVVEVSRFAAKVAHDQSDYEGSVTAARKAVETADRLQNDLVRAEASARLASALGYLRNFDGAKEQLAAARAALQRAGGDARAELAVLEAHSDVGRLAQWADQVAVNEQRVARTRASHGNHSAVLANALFELHLASVQDAKDPRAERAALEAAEIFKHLGAGEAVVAGTIARMAAAQAAQDLGALVEASRAGVTAFETYAPEAEGVLYAWKSLATNLELAGRPAEAVSAYERAVARYHATGKEDRVLLRGLLKSLADMQLDSGKPEAALETLARGIALLGETPPEKDESGLHVLKGRTLLALGRHVEAIAILDRLVEPARARPNKGRFAMICWSLAQALHASGGPRSQALALAGDAERAFLVAIEAASKHWMAVNIARDYERRRAEVRAWIAAHRR